MDSLPLPRSWADLADILALAFLLQRAWLLLRGTTALRYLLGLGAVWLGARASGLPLTSWVFLWLGPAGVLILIVAFRDEFREALMRTDPLHLLLGGAGTARPADLAAIAAAVFRMASQRVGALLVFQNRDTLAIHAREGVDLDARISPELVESLFAKTSPVHDGAVVIQGRRIERAGTFLPLTIRPNLPVEYGTRHRAAIGLTELCDALVVVVSEERGEVAVAHRGVVEKTCDVEALVAAIRRALPREASRERGSVRGLARRAGKSLLGYAAALAVIGLGWTIHAYGNRGHSSLATFAVPLDYRNLPAGLWLRGDGPNGRPPESVEVQISGVDLPIRALRRDEITAFVDLAALPVDPRRGGDVEVRLGAGNVDLPPGYEVESLRPGTFALTLEGTAERALPVRPGLGDPPRGFAFAGRPAVSPVRVVGPKSVVDGIDELATQLVVLRDSTPAADARMIEVEAPIILSPPSLRLVDPADARVRIQVPIQRVNE